MNNDKLTELLKQLIIDEQFSVQNISADNLDLLIEKLQDKRKNMINQFGIIEVNKIINTYCSFSKNNTYFKSDNLKDLQQFANELTVLAEEIAAANTDYSSDSVSSIGTDSSSD